MKCKKCGGEISFETKYCPYCGALNEDVKKHYEDMERYQKEFSSTKEEVYQSTRKYSAFSVKLILLILLTFMILAVFLLGLRPYSFRRLYLEKQANKNYTAYCQEMEDYIEEKDYLGLAGFIEEKDIYYNDKYNDYYMIMQTVRQYSDILYYCVSMTQPKEMVNPTGQSSSLADALNYLYRYADPKEYEYYDENVTSSKNIEIVKDIVENVQGLLKVYFDLSDEQVKELPTMSKGKRLSIIEDAMRQNVSEEE